MIAPFLFYRPVTRFGLTVAAIVCALDQAPRFTCCSFSISPPTGRSDLVLSLISFSHAIRASATAFSRRRGRSASGYCWASRQLPSCCSCVWLARAQDRLIALSLGLIIGGAIGNAIDRLAYGWVADFVFFHISTANWRFDWYVFNLADVAIVAGVIGLLYDSLVMDRAAKAP